MGGAGATERPGARRCDAAALLVDHYIGKGNAGSRSGLRHLRDRAELLQEGCLLSLGRADHGQDDVGGVLAVVKDLLVGHLQLGIGAEWVAGVGIAVPAWEAAGCHLQPDAAVPSIHGSERTTLAPTSVAHQRGAAHLPDGILTPSLSAP
jgi:hypothetical protein